MSSDTITALAQSEIEASGHTSRETANAMRERIVALEVHLERMRQQIEQDYAAANMTPPEIVGQTPDVSLAEHNAEVVRDLQFPVMLRKMWSGGEIQQWLNEQADDQLHRAREPLK